jgi:acyl carrier protein
MKDIIIKSIKELNTLLPKEKKIVIKNSTPLIDEKSKLESIDLVNLFVNLEKNLKEKSNLVLTFDEIVENTEHLKTIGSLESFLIKKSKNEKK